MSMQAFQTALLVVGIAVSGTTCGFVIKNFCDTKKQTKAIEQNGKCIVALTAQSDKDHKEIINKLDENTKVILASEKQIIEKLETKTPPKGGEVVDPRVANASQQDSDSVQSENEQVDPLVAVIERGFQQWAGLYDSAQKMFAEVNENAEAQKHKITKQNDNALHEIAAGMVKEIRNQIEQEQE